MSANQTDEKAALGARRREIAKRYEEQRSMVLGLQAREFKRATVAITLNGPLVSSKAVNARVTEALELLDQFKVGVCVCAVVSDWLAAWANGCSHGRLPQLANCPSARHETKLAPVAVGRAS
jgi:hypothetical protein